MRIVEALGIAKVTGPVVKVVISVDATHMWHQSATRCDAFVDVQGEEGRWAGCPSMWSTWFTFDGPDDCGPLRVADEKGGLNAMVADLQKEGVVVCGQRYPVLCYLKGMKAAHHKEGSRCWHCDTAFADFGGETWRRARISNRVCGGGHSCGISPRRDVLGIWPTRLAG